MSTEGTPTPKNHVYYGWVVIGACTLLLATSLGICYSFGVFFTSLEEQFDWSRATTSTLFSLYLLLAGLFSIVGGWASDTFGPKPVVLVMGAISGLSLFLTSQVDSAWQLYLTYSVLLSLGTGAMYIIVVSTGSRWFLRKRATALGIIGAGAGIGTVIMAPVSASLISAYDWRDAYAIVGIIAWVLIIPFAFLLKRDPSEVNAQPDGGSISHISENVNAASMEEFSINEATKTRNFWMFFVIWFAYSFCLHMVMSHVVPRAEDVGISPIRAATILSILTAVTIPTRMVIGFISDMVGKKTVGFLFALLHAIAMFWLVDIDQLWMFYLFAVIYGVAYGGIDPPITASISDTFGVRQVGSIMGILMIGWGLGSAAGPYFSGLIFDRTGSYQFAFFCGGMIMAVAAFFIWRLPSQPVASHSE